MWLLLGAEGDMDTVGSPIAETGDGGGGKTVQKLAPYFSYRDL